MKPRLFSTFFCLVFFFSFTTAQTSQTDHFGLKKSQIKSLSTVQLKKGTKTFPDSYLYGMHGDSLVLLTDISGWNDKSLFAKSTISIGGYDELIVSSKEEKRRKSLIWGSIVGVASFAIARNVTKSKSYERTLGKGILGQQLHNGYIEATIAGVTGFGVGMIIGQTLARRTLNLKTQKRKALKELRPFSYK